MAEMTELEIQRRRAQEAIARVEEARAAEAAARAKAMESARIAQEALAAARTAEDNAVWQKTGRHPSDPMRGTPPKGAGIGPDYRAAKAEAEKARARAEAASATATQARQIAAEAEAKARAADVTMERATRRITEIDNLEREQREADAKALQTVTAISAGLTASATTYGLTKFLENRDGRKLVQQMAKDIDVLNANKSGPAATAAMQRLKATTSALKKTGLLSPVDTRHIAGKASISLGLTAALMGTSQYLKSVAADQRAAGNEKIASTIETIALAEQYAAVGIAAKGSIGTVYTAAAKFGKPKLRPNQLATVEQAQALMKGTADKADDAADLIKAGRQMGVKGLRKGMTADKVKQVIEASMAAKTPPATSTAKAAASATVKAATSSTAKVGTMSVIKPLTRIGTKVLRAVPVLGAGLGGYFAVSAFSSTSAEAKERGASSLEANARGAAAAADSFFLMGLGQVIKDAVTKAGPPQASGAALRRQARNLPGGFTGAGSMAVPTGASSMAGPTRGSEVGPQKTRAYLNDNARSRAQVAQHAYSGASRLMASPRSMAAPTPARGPGQAAPAPGRASKQFYVTTDGKSVQGTAAQIAAWNKRKTSVSSR